MDSFETSAPARLFIQHGGVSARGSHQNTPALHAKTQGATRVQQFACERIEPYFSKAICPWVISNSCLQNWSFRAFEILYPVLENTSVMDTTFQIRSFKITTPLGGTYPYNNIMYGSTPPPLPAGMPAQHWIARSRPWDKGRGGGVFKTRR